MLSLCDDLLVYVTEFLEYADHVSLSCASKSVSACGLYLPERRRRLVVSMLRRTRAFKKSHNPVYVDFCVVPNCHRRMSRNVFFAPFGNIVVLAPFCECHCQERRYFPGVFRHSINVRVHE